MPQHDMEKLLTEMADSAFLDDADAFETPDEWQLSDFEDILPARR